ncbi:hypothetical protein XENOCAPTIV_009793 [Xenoophorus captivus]|uniref:Uncharacterized protein n=1 Tax=Xenoophorus captivus TaxID=1517983 RepID=A0ABV0QHI1_9TELE
MLDKANKVDHHPVFLFALCSPFHLCPSFLMFSLPSLCPSFLVSSFPSLCSSSLHCVLPSFILVSFCLYFFPCDLCSFFSCVPPCFPSFLLCNHSFFTSFQFLSFAEIIYVKQKSVINS